MRLFAFSAGSSEATAGPPGGRRRVKVAIALGIILAFALLIRVYNSTSVVYSNPDEALLAYFAVNLAKLSPLEPDIAQNALARMMSWDYGWPLLVVQFAWIRVIDAVNIPINEATIVLPQVLAGTAVCLLTFLVGRAIKDERAGLLAAAFMAVAPLPVMNSRSVGRVLSPASALFLLAVLMLIRYMHRPQSSRRRMWAGVSVGLYLCSDLQFPVAAVALLLLMALWPKPEGYDTPKKTAQMFLRPRFLIPPIVLFVPYVAAYLYACSLGYPDQTYLGSILVEHSYDWGFHVVPWLRDLSRNIGSVLAVVSLLSVAALVYHRRNRRYSWLICWIALTAAPFVFAVTGRVTIASGYHVHLIVGLAIAAGIGVSMLKNPWAVSTAAVIIVATTFPVTARGVFGFGVFRETRAARNTPYGGVPPDNGLKAAGYWVRRNVPKDATVHVIHDPAVAYWYMGREASELGYTTWPEYRQYLHRHGGELDVVVVPESQASWEKLDLPERGFEGLVSIVDDGQVVCRIATRWPVEETLVLERANALYNQTYNSVDTILPEMGPYVPGKPLVLPAG